MSQYLLDRITATANIVVRLPERGGGGPRRGASGGSDHYRPGARGRRGGVRRPGCSCSSAPHRGRSGSAPQVVRDPAGFVVTGPERLGGDADSWPLARPPYALETSVPGVFAVGDVRLEWMKRVASAVGEGAMAVHLLAPLPGDHMIHRRRPAPDRSLRWPHRRPAPRTGRVRGPRSRWTPARWLFRGGGAGRLLVGAAGGEVFDLVRRTGREDTVVARMDQPGRWAGGLETWTSTAPTSPRPRGRTPGRLLRIPSSALRERVGRVVPVRCPPDRGPLQHGPHHRGDGPAAQRPGDLGHAGGRAGPRDRQPRPRRRPRSVDGLHSAWARVESSLG